MILNFFAVFFEFQGILFDVCSNFKSILRVYIIGFDLLHDFYNRSLLVLILIFRDLKIIDSRFDLKFLNALTLIV